MLDTMLYTIISIREQPEYAERGIDYYAARWGIERKEYEISVGDCIRTGNSLPRWYLMLDAEDGIIGGFGLIQNDFVDRVDLFPYLCALSIEPCARGQALGSQLLMHGRKEAARLGYDRMFLCTDHIGYYEKYGWEHIGTGHHPWGSTSRIYEARTVHPADLVEPMSDFFTARVEGYDEHMLNNVEGCKEAYQKLAELIPATAATLLDLGCGTGLELDEIFKIKPDLQVTGIDLTKAMLDKLQAKHPGKDITLINASYFDHDFGTARFDAVISFQTMHHFAHEEKIRLYTKIGQALKTGGQYIECDYMVLEQKDEDYFFQESARIRCAQQIPDGEFYHYDTPCTVANQIGLLRAAGLTDARMVWRMGNTTIVVAQ